MTRKKLPYDEGDWCVVPVRGGGYALGLLARMDGRGTLLGYFFGPRRAHPPTLDDARTLRPGGEALVALLGDLGLLNGEWRVVGRAAGWQRGEWPVPDFGRVSRLGQWVHAWRIHYADSNLDLLYEEPCLPTEVEGLPEDGLSGYGAIEIKLSQLLGNEGDRATARTQAPAAVPARVSADLFDDDVAADVRGVFEEALAADPSPNEAASRVLEQMSDALEDVDDAPVIWLALACLLRDRGVTAHRALERARDILATGTGLERWQDAGPEALASRQKLYDRLAAHLR